MSDVEKIISLIQSEKVDIVDLRFTDTRGKEQHVSIPASQIKPDFFEDGKAFDGSSIAGWAKINKSDLVLKPDCNAYYIDPFTDNYKMLNLRCDILDPTTLQGYNRDPRTLAKRAEAYLVNTGIADEVFFGPEPEFFIFDDVKYKVGMDGAEYSVDSMEAAWNSGRDYQHGNLGHRPQIKGGYFPVPPVDSFADIRTEISMILESLDIPVEAHHHEVATSGQNEIAVRYNSLLNKADEMMTLKYVVQNAVHRKGKTATFMPKPVFGDNGNGMHCHQSLSKDGKNLFSGDKYAGLSDIALYYVGGIIKHARTLNLFTNPTTNSYKRLVPGFEAPVLLAYSSRNRSAAIRVPYVTESKARRIEVRFPDPLANPYLAFSAMMMAGIDGIINKIHPGEPMEKDLYDLPPEEKKDVATVCASLDQAIQAAKEDSAFLMEGDVFSQEMLDSYIDLKQAELEQFRMVPHPIEFELYYSQ